jgi:ribonuclease III
MPLENLPSLFTNPTPLMRQALTHRSLATKPTEGNERLEFLGDALLGAFVAEYLVEHMPDANEGSLSRARTEIVRKEALAEVARKLKIQDYLQVGEGEKKENRQESDTLLSNAYEAVLAAIYLDQGKEAFADFVTLTLGEKMHAIVQSPPERDAKTRLQEKMQASGEGLPIYLLEKMDDFGSYRHFRIQVCAPSGEILGVGEGPNRRTAEQQAAQNALNR